jgi:hypothetical protein
MSREREIRQRKPGNYATKSRGWVLKLYTGGARYRKCHFLLVYAREIRDTQLQDAIIMGPLIQKRNTWNLGIH